MHRISLLLVGVMASACAAETGGALEMRSSPLPSATCAFLPNATSVQTRGNYDPRGYDGIAPVDYTLALAMRNNLDSADTNPLTPSLGTGSSSANVRPNANNVNVLGYDVCWIRADDPRVSKYGSHSDGVPVDCDKVPADQKRFSTDSFIIEAGGGEGVGFVRVLTVQDLQAAGMYGAAFDPVAIPSVSTGTNPGDVIFLQSEDPSSANRSAAWGTYPTTRESTVIIQARAIGKTQNGSSVQSDWASYPVVIDIGAIGAACGPINVVTCEDASTGLQGATPNLQGCLPFQFYSLSCEDINTCL